MSGPRDATALRLEEALRLLPDVDALVQLRRALYRGAHARVLAQPHGTVGKRQLEPMDLGQLLADALSHLTRHSSQLYQAAITALRHLQCGDVPGAVRSLLDAGELERRLGHYTQAHAWFQQALEAARPLRDRRPEIDALRHLGDLQFEREQLTDAARWYQRSLALAEAEADHGNAWRACRGLGEVAIAQSRWAGAESWYTRGLQHAGGDPTGSAELALGLATVARQRGQHEAVIQRLQQARALFERLADAAGIVRVLNEHARLERLLGHLREASELHQEALAHLRAAGADAQLEIPLRLDLCRLYIDWGRLHDAEDEVRRVEERAIATNQTRELARAYLMLGQVHAQTADEEGFIFFENAIALCQGREPLPRLEAEIYLEYGMFRDALGDHGEAHAYLLRAREILEKLGEDSLLPKVSAKLAQLGAG